MSYKKMGPFIAGVFIFAFLLSVVPHTNAAIHGMKKIKTGVINAVVLGDSIALSARATNPSTTGWTADLDSQLKNAFPVGKIQWTIMGLNGSGVDYALKRSFELMKDTDVVYICTGRNDAKDMIMLPINQNILNSLQISKKQLLMQTSFASLSPRWFQAMTPCSMQREMQYWIRFTKPMSSGQILGLNFQKKTAN